MMKCNILKFFFIFLVLQSSFCLDTSANMKFYYDENKDIIYIENAENGFKTSVSNVFYYTEQISDDKTKILVFTRPKDVYSYDSDIYIIDTEKKEKKCIKKTWGTIRSNSDITFLLCEKKFDTPLDYELYDIESGKIYPLALKIENPDITREAFITSSIYRSTSKNFDFTIKLNYDSTVIAEYGFSLKDMKFYKVLDNTEYPKCSTSDKTEEDITDETDFKLNFQTYNRR